jgi:predicted Rossmann-fold nucleotide-binding protein
MKCIIAGGRDYHLTDADRAFLDQLGVTEVVCGGAPGADTGGAEWARTRGLPVRYFPADWNTYGRAAGPIRNRQMAEYCREAVVLFPGGRGTASMRGIALELGLRVITPGKD